jgi:hypothetical protein
MRFPIAGFALSSATIALVLWTMGPLALLAMYAVGVLLICAAARGMGVES